jgi:hypothetical protein
MKVMRVVRTATSAALEERPENVDTLLVKNRVPVSAFGQLSHDMRCHFSLRDPQQVAQASKLLTLAQVAYKALLSPCPECKLALVLTILSERVNSPTYHLE